MTNRNYAVLGRFGLFVFAYIISGLKSIETVVSAESFTSTDFLKSSRSLLEFLHLIIILNLYLLFILGIAYAAGPKIIVFISEYSDSKYCLIF